MTPLNHWWAVLWAVVMIGGPFTMIVMGVPGSTLVAFPVAILAPCVIAAWRFLR